jgi:hypothetical protein
MAIKINQNNITFGSYTLEETPTGLLFDGNITAFFPPAVGGAPTPSPSPPPPPPPPGGPTYSVVAAAGNVNEGSSLTFNVTTTEVANGTTLYWTVSRPEDFATSSGSFTINSNAGSFSVTPTADSTTEGAETFTASVRTVSTSGTIVATSGSVTINDTSTTPPPPPPPGSNPPSAQLLTFNFTVPTTTNGPINIYYRRLLFKSIYTAAELNAAGWTSSATIYRISFYVTSVPLYQPIPSWTIGMQNTTSAVATDLTTGWTIVRNAANASFTVNTENIITLNTPFTWNGTSNLAIGFASSQISPTWNSSGVVRGNTPGSSRGAFTDSSGTYLLTNAAPSTHTYRPVITLYNSL